MEKKTVVGEEKVDPLEQLNERLINAIEEAKSIKNRTQSLKSISELLANNYIWELVERRKLTISEIIENSLRHGKGTAQELAVKICLLLQIQLGGDDYEYTKTLDELLLKMLSDKLNGLEVRAECCKVLGLFYFMQYENIDDLIKLMQYLEDIFVNVEKSTISSEESILHTAALYSYGLLFTKISPADIYIVSRRLCVSMNWIIKLLDSQHLNIRLASGETICVLTECGTSRNPKIMHDLIPHIFSVTKYLSVNNRRNRYKQKSNSQRVTFKDIDRYIENRIQPEITVHFGSETILLKTWAGYQQYMTLYEIIGPGIEVHLMKNNFIRNIFHLDKNIVYPAVKKSQHTVARRKNRQSKTE